MEHARKANPKVSAKYFPKKGKERIDTADGSGHFNKNHNVLMDAFTAWTALDSFRKKARRNKMYTFEDQWGDSIKTKCGWITERESILNQGNIPLQNNRIRGILRSVSGVFQSQQTEPVCVARDRDEQGAGDIMSSTVQYVYQLNKLWGLDAANFQYFLVTGLAAFKSIYGWRNGKMDVWTDIVNPNHMFFDPHMQDSRHWDCHLVGQIHDVGIYDAMAQFAEGSREKAERIRSIYAYCERERTVTYLEDNLTKDVKRNLDFFIPLEDSTRCRVIEVWKKESKERLLVHDWLTGDYYKAETTEAPAIKMENEKRVMEQGSMGVLPEDMKLVEYEWFIDNYWYYYYLSPQGDVLKEGETPFWHESHPYTFRVYPFYDGQAFPFVSDFIDQQRYINRLIMLQDFVTRSSAKGVLAVPEESIPDGMTVKDFADEWAVFNGVILYKSKGGASPPHQIVSNTSQLGLTDMLSIQLKLLEDISGVQGALQGKSPSAGTPASLYMQQTQNATTSLTELFEAYREVREERDTKNMKLVQQFYTEPKYINITGKGNRPETMVYDPGKVRNAEFDLSITESASTPAYRMVMNEFLMELFKVGQITLADLLENGSFPFADKLLESVRKRQKEAEQAQQAMMSGGQPVPMQQGIAPQDISQTVTQGANPIIQQMLSGTNQNATQA
ncbi:hypothetical protein FACS1894181_13190 [Bacteroidia bacterium]|nr:hypothetical protein FACS1894181_13190 [Bacteroidia bacterium]